jgi:hypothetical protein
MTAEMREDAIRKGWSLDDIRDWPMLHGVVTEIAAGRWRRAGYGSTKWGPWNAGRPGEDPVRCWAVAAAGAGDEEPDLSRVTAGDQVLLLGRQHAEALPEIVPVGVAMRILRDADRGDWEAIEREFLSLLKPE